MTGPDQTGNEGRVIRPFLGDRRYGASASREPGAADLTKPRPYVLTSGRVSDAGVGPETQVLTRADRPPVILSPELAAIVNACLAPLSVAEVSARLGLHLGVTRVLIGDLRAAGQLYVHAQDPAESHSPETILRVIRGLRAIR
jgi:hypothetical protein